MARQTFSLRVQLGIMALLMVLLPAAVQAGGFKIPDQSTRAMGMIDAFVAGADDASAIYYNPAGLTRLTGPQLISNLYFAHGINYYDGAAGSDTSDGRFYVVPNFFFAVPVADCPPIVLGIGVYSPFGLGSKWSDDSRVRYYSTLGEIELININPTVAVKLTDRLSAGAGIDYFTSRAKLRKKDDYRPFFPDGETDMEADGEGWGFNLGLQYDLTPDVVLGLTYRSQINVHYDGDVQMDGVPVSLMPPITINTWTGMNADIEFPQSIAAGVQWKATDRLRVELAAEWQNWSTRKTQVFDLDGIGPQAQPVNWEDSWLIMLGGEYDLTEKWTLRAGYGYNETPVPDGTADPSLPTGDTHAVSLGAGYKFSEKISFDVAGIVAYGEKRTLNNPFNPPGDNDYEAVSFFLSFGVTYNF
jgi:long-chain fatty acid transport protein